MRVGEDRAPLAVNGTRVEDAGEWNAVSIPRFGADGCHGGDVMEGCRSWKVECVEECIVGSMLMIRGWWAMFEPFRCSGEMIFT